jgi:hypothetical protein
MKKELLYFAAGAVVMGAILYASQDKNISIDCDVIAGAVSKGTDKGLTRKEKVAVAIVESRSMDMDMNTHEYFVDRNYKKAYKACLRAYPL